MTNLPANADPSRASASAPRRTLSQQMDDVQAKFMALPQRQRWLLGAVGIVLAYFAIDSLCWQRAAEWSSESDQIEQALARDSARAAGVSTDLKRAIRTFGPVEAPGDPADGRQALDRAINDIAKKHHFVASYESRTGQRIKDGDSGILGSSVERLQAEVKFDTTAEELPRILDEIEMHPAIEGISALRLQKNENTRKITVQATIEAWVVGTGSRRGS